MHEPVLHEGKVSPDITLPNARRSIFSFAERTSKIATFLNISDDRGIIIYFFDIDIFLCV